VGVCGWLGRAGLRGLAFRLPPGAYLPACWVGKGLGDMGLAVPSTRYWKGRQVISWCGGVDGWPLEESGAKGGFEAGLFLRV
jgi:hypothetical protein